MRKAGLIVSVLHAVLLALAAAPVFAYDVAAVTGGGKIEGKVLFQGNVPIKKIIPTKDREVCGGARDEPQIRVGAEIGRAHV